MAEDAGTDKAAAALGPIVRACIDAGMAVIRAEIDPETGKVTVHGEPAPMRVEEPVLMDCDLSGERPQRQGWC